MSFAAAPGMDELCINSIRTLSMDAIQKANSGHPGAPMGLAPTDILWSKIMKHNPKNPAWLDRTDSFCRAVRLHRFFTALRSLRICRYDG